MPPTPCHLSQTMLSLESNPISLGFVPYFLNYLYHCLNLELACYESPLFSNYFFLFHGTKIPYTMYRYHKQLKSDFGPTFTKPPNYLLSCNVTVAKWIISCSQHIVLVIWIEFPPKLYQVTLLLARKVKLPKCQEISYYLCWGWKTVLLLPLVDVT